MQKKPKQKRNISDNFFAFVIVMMVVVGLAVLALAAIFYFSKFGTTYDTHGWANFGEYLSGTVGPFLDLLALLALLITVIVQLRELRVSNQELSQSNQALTVQAESMGRQTFENTFFHLLSTHVENLNSVDLEITYGGSTATKTVIGRDCFDSMFYQISANYQQSQDHAAAYQICMQLYSTDLDPYTDHLEHMLRFVDLSEVADKAFYGGLVRAQLSKYELGVLFYHALQDGNASFRKLAERYGLFANLDDAVVQDPSHRQGLAETAYQR